MNIEFSVLGLVLAEFGASGEPILPRGKRIWEPNGGYGGRARGAGLEGAPPRERGLCHVYTCAHRAL